MKKLVMLLAVLAPRIVAAQSEPDAPPESGSDTVTESDTTSTNPAGAASPQPSTASSSSSASSSTSATSTTATTSGSSPATNDDAADPVTRSTSLARFDPWQARRFLVELDTFGDLETVRQDGPDLEQFRLGRAELGTTVGLGPAWRAELRLEAIRSATEGGALGIDGDSLVVRVKRAQIAGDTEIRGVMLGGAGGLVADPWIAALETDYTLRPLSATASERHLGWPTSDLSALGRVGYGPARLTVSIGNGEGLRYPERNNGQTTTAVLEIVPIATRWHGEPLRVRLAAVGRDGSLGPASVRDHRFGGAATARSAFGSAGIEAVRAWGIGSLGDLEGFTVGGWLEARPIARLAIAGRASTIGYSGVGDGRATSTGGAIAYDAWRDRGNAGNVRIWLAVDRTTSTGSAMPLAGADAGDATTVMLMLSALGLVEIK